MSIINLNTQSSKIILLTAVLLTSGNTMAIEEAEYSVINQEKKFELRKYQPHMVAEIIIEEEFSEAGSKAFRPLFKYITGDNKVKQEIVMTAPVSQSSNQKIAMTAPVGQQQRDGKWAISFMMPASFTLDNIPQPNNPKVKVRQVSERLVASVRYSGSWSTEKYQQHLSKLNTWITTQKYQPIGQPIWAKYNSPYALWFMRRNEILIPVTVKSVEASQ